MLNARRFCAWPGKLILYYNIACCWLLILRNPTKYKVLWWNSRIECHFLGPCRVQHSSTLSHLPHEVCFISNSKSDFSTSSDYGTQIFPKKEKFVFLSSDRTLWMVLGGLPPGILFVLLRLNFKVFKKVHFPGDCVMCFGVCPPSSPTCSTLKIRWTLRLQIISGVTRRDSGLKWETGLWNMQRGEIKWTSPCQPLWSFFSPRPKLRHHSFSLVPTSTVIQTHESINLKYVNDLTQSKWIM